MHEKLKKYPCKVCGKMFGNQGNLYVHNQRHHERYVLTQFFSSKVHSFLKHCCARSSVDSKQGTSAKKGFVKVPCFESTEDRAFTVYKTNGL